MITAQEERDHLIKKLWCVLKELADDRDTITEEDLNLLFELSQHSAISSVLDAARQQGQLPPP